MGLEVVGLRICSVQYGVGTMFWVQQLKIIASKWNHREKQRDPRILDAQRTVTIIRCQSLLANTAVRDVQAPFIQQRSDMLLLRETIHPHRTVFL